MRKYSYVALVSILSILSVCGQSTIDLSKVETHLHTRFPGTNVSIDTTGLNLIFSNDAWAYINENDRTFFGVEQKQISIENYESIIGNQLRFDSIILENNIVFNAFKGKLILGKVINEEIENDVWMCYIGNQDYVIEIKGFYNSVFQSKHRASFEKIIKSLYIASDRILSIYEDLPFYLDENRFLYIKEMSFMPESIALSQEVEGNKRTVTVLHLSASQEEIEELKKEYIVDTENFTQDGKEIILSVSKTDERIALEGIIVFGNRVIILNGISSINDENALSEFKEMAKSIEFK